MITIVILAAGKGKRMQSNLPKVLHTVADITMLEHVLLATQIEENIQVIVVASPELSAHVYYRELSQRYNFSTAIQSIAEGTGAALAAALPMIVGHNIIVLAGDTPLVTKHTVHTLYQHHIQENADITVASFTTNTPFGYGRMVIQHDILYAIIEEKDADIMQKQITQCNAGIYCFNAESLRSINRLQHNNQAQEYYLTDMVALNHQDGRRCIAYNISEVESLGVNNQKQLAVVNNIMQERLQEKAMLNGVHIIDSKSVWLAADANIAAGVVIEPQVVIKKNVTINEGAIIKSFSYLEGVVVGKNCQIGPFARIRPNSVVEDHATVGNFVELKNAKLASGVKAGHLSYLGDVEIGLGSNIGAGTIVCNYNGEIKQNTKIGNYCFIGSNSTLIAPLSVADGSLVAAGSVINQNVPANSLAIARVKQMTKTEHSIAKRITNNLQKKRG